MPDARPDVGPALSTGGTSGPVTGLPVLRKQVASATSKVPGRSNRASKPMLLPPEETQRMEEAEV